MGTPTFSSFNDVVRELEEALLQIVGGDKLIIPFC